MTLDPDSYECPDHKIDLTDRVEEAVEDQDWGPQAFGRRGGAASGDFEVMVTCPGVGDSGSHQLTCSGTQRP